MGRAEPQCIEGGSTGKYRLLSPLIVPKRSMQGASGKGGSSASALIAPHLASGDMAEMAQDRIGVRETRINGRKLRIDRDVLPSQSGFGSLLLSVAALQIGRIRAGFLGRMLGNRRTRAWN
jgi:hypothetical protein